MAKDSTPQKAADYFYMMVGHCITEWAKVDDELFRIFSDCVGPYEQSAIIYYRTPGLNVRLELTDEIVKSVLPRPPRKSGGHAHPSVTAWKDTVEGFRGLLGTRRRIAHQPIVVKHGATWPLNLDLSYMLAPPSWFEINVSQHEQVRSDEIPAALNVDDLEAHLTAVATLRDRLQHFFSNVLTKRESASSAPSLPPTIPLIQETDPSTKSQQRRKPSPP